MATTLKATFPSAKAAAEASETLLKLGYGSEAIAQTSNRLARPVQSTEYVAELDATCREDHASFVAHGEHLGTYPSLAPHYESSDVARPEADASSATGPLFSLTMVVEDQTELNRVKEVLTDSHIVKLEEF